VSRDAFADRVTELARLRSEAGSIPIGLYAERELRRPQRTAGSSDRGRT
jgi:hypothetical protein